MLLALKVQLAGFRLMLHEDKTWRKTLGMRDFIVKTRIIAGIKSK